VARDGERDPDELCARALKALGFSIRQIDRNRNIMIAVAVVVVILVIIYLYA
jgi:hypothetical protein